MYVLLDSNVTAAYYLPRSTRSKRVRDRIQIVFDSVRSKKRDDFFYLPNFCIAEVFSVFMKHSFGRWNSHTRGNTIDTRHYKRIVDQFVDDIHNGKFIYHYELSRYHVLGMNLVAPIDHYFQISRKPNVTPMGTFDHLLIAMGMHLNRVHGRDNFVLLTADKRVADVLNKCSAPIPASTQQKLKLTEDKIKPLTGMPFHPDTFPRHLNLAHATKQQMVEIFGEWPLPVGNVPSVGRYLVV